MVDKNGDQIVGHACPSCGAPVQEGQSTCTRCGVELSVVPDFEHSDIPEEKEMRKLLLHDSKVDEFFFKLNDYLDRIDHTSHDVWDPKVAEALQYSERVLAWMEAHEEEIRKIEERVNQGVRRPQIPALDTMKNRIQFRRKEYLALLNNGWIASLQEHVNEFPANARNELIPALEKFMDAANKEVSGEVQNGKLTPADRLIKVLFTPEMVLELKKVVQEVSQQAQVREKPKSEQGPLQRLGLRRRGQSN